MHCTTQIALIELIRGFVPIQATFKIEIAKVDVTIQKDLPDAFALISCRTKALLLCEPERRVRRSDSDDAWMIQVFLRSTKENVSVLPDVHHQVLQQVGI